MEKTVELLLKTWNTIKSGSLTIELAQNTCILKVSIDPKNFELDIIEPKATLLQTLKTLIPSREISAQLAVPEPTEIEKLGIKERLNKLKTLLETLEPYAQKLSLQNKNVILKYRGEEIFKMGADTVSPLLKFLDIKKIALPNKLALLKFIKEFYK